MNVEFLNPAEDEFVGENPPDDPVIVGAMLK